MFKQGAFMDLGVVGGHLRVDQSLTGATPPVAPRAHTQPLPTPTG